VRRSVIASYSANSRPGATDLTPGLEADGLVQRTTDPTDNRAVTVTITAHGLKKFEPAYDLHQQDLTTHLFSLLTDREISQLGSITNKILDA
jgi:DNA-binding MarR family transcriptional regulator